MGDVEVDSSEDDSEDNGEEVEYSLTNSMQAVILSKSIEQENKKSSGIDYFLSNTLPASNNSELYQ